MNVRLAVIEDVESMSQVVVDTWKIAYKGLISQAYLNKLTTKVYNERFKRQINAKKMLFLVAQVQEKIVGMLQADVKIDSMRIQMLYVLPQYHHQGVGKALLNQCIDQCSNNSSISKVILDVLDKNDMAKEFYKKNGFVASGQKQESQINGGLFWVKRFEKLVKKS